MIPLHAGEKVIQVIRRHWFVIFVESSFFVFMSLFPVFMVVLTYLFVPPAFEFLRENISVALFFYLAWFLALWIFFIVIWTDYYLDVLIITNKRVIDIEQQGLFSRDVAEVGLNNVQDVRVEVNGVLATVLGFGEIHIQSAGSEREFVIKTVPHPIQIKDLIGRYHHQN